MIAPQSVREVRANGTPAFELTSDGLAVLVIPAFGGRVVSLVDRASGRNWLLPGRLPAGDLSGNDAVFSSGVAWGWDECLPTVTPCPDPLVPGTVLRDHGDVWGRTVDADLDGEQLRLTLLVGGEAGTAYAFRRTIALDGRRLSVAYELENRGLVELAFLWSMHPLLALEPGATLRVPDVADVEATFAAGAAVADFVPGGKAGRVTWPSAGRPSGARHDFAVVPGLRARDAVKLYAGPLNVCRAAVAAPDGTWLGLRWDAGMAAYLGIWISNGGWPSPEAGVRQYALEPTTAPADSLASAIAKGRAQVLPPGGRLEWWATLQVGSSAASLEVFLADRDPVESALEPTSHERFGRRRMFSGRAGASAAAPTQPARDRVPASAGHFDSRPGPAHSWIPKEIAGHGPP